MTQTPRYTASVVGGGSGGKLSLAGLAQSNRFDLIAVADLRDDVRSDLLARYPDIRTYGSHERMFADCPTDVVCVSTWPPSHLRVALAALRMGVKGMLCEKPLADTWLDGHDLLEALKTAHVPVVVPHGLIRLGHSEEILARVHRGEIGELELVEIECGKWDIINAGIHWLNFFVNLVPGDPMAWVMAITESSTRTHRDGMQVETTAITYVQTLGGVRAVMHTGDDVEIRRPDKGFIFRLVGTEGMIEFWAFESAYRILNRACPEARLIRVERNPISHHQRYLEELADQIDEGRTDYRLPETSLAALELCEAAYLSSAHRCKVNLPLSEFEIPVEPDWSPGKPYEGKGGRDGRKL